MLFLINMLSGTLPFSLLILTGTVISFKTKFSQITEFPKSLALTLRAFKAKKRTGEITSFSAACTALSATVGTGNIAGVAGAISIGGAGAVFWMWVSAVLGMAIKSAEISLSVAYRERRNGEFSGGPMYYIKNGLPKFFKPLGMLFCLAAIPAVFFSGNITQINSAASVFESSPAIRWGLGLIFAIFTFLAIKGGFSAVARVTEKIVPLMSVLYIALSLWVILKNVQALPHCFYLIFKGAFNPKAATGGAVGSFVSCAFIGAARGIFSNEAGLGTSGMAHAAAVDAHSKTQGLFGIFEVFVDTILLCTLTALTILCSGVKINYGENASTELVLHSLEPCLGKAAIPVLGIMMCLFAFSSIIGWAVYGKLCVDYAFGERANKAFTFIYPIACIAGALLSGNKAWGLASLCNGIMLCINLTALLLGDIYVRKKN